MEILKLAEDMLSTARGVVESATEYERVKSSNLARGAVNASTEAISVSDARKWLTDNHPGIHRDFFTSEVWGWFAAFIRAHQGILHTDQSSAEHPYQQKIRSVLNEAYEERQRQNAKWGEQNHNPVEWLSILLEEVGEASKEAVDHHFRNPPKGWGRQFSPSVLGFDTVQSARLRDYRAEMIQVISVACQMVESLDRQNPYL